ncbi:hypothetical protein ACSQ67_006231 [Phaseolus vulgaris]
MRRWWLGKVVISLSLKPKGKKTIGSECRERSDCVEPKGSQFVKELYELKRMLECAMLFSNYKRSPVVEKEDILYENRTTRIRSPFSRGILSHNCDVKTTKEVGTNKEHHDGEEGRAKVLMDRFA